MKVCMVGASGKLGRYMVRHALDRGYDVVGSTSHSGARDWSSRAAGTSPATARAALENELIHEAPAIVGCRTLAACTRRRARLLRR
jgi:nucleoside-diphosphate-sugar epimerase